MELKELFVQSVGPFLSPRKFQFGDGLNLVFGKNGSGKTTLALSLFALFDSKVISTGRERFKPWVPQDTPSRIGSVFFRNERWFKILRDVESLGVAIQERKGGKFVTVAKGAQVEDFLIDELDLPFGEDFYKLMFLGEDLDLSVKKSAGGVSAAVSSSPFDGFEDVAAAPSAAPENREERLKILKEELERAEKVEELEFKMEGLEQKLFELSDKAREIERLQGEVEKINQFLNRYSEIQNFPVDFDKKLEEIPEMKKEVERLEEELEIDREELEAELEEERAKVRKFHRDPIFIVTVLVTLLGFLLPPVTKLPGWLVFFGLGGIAFTVYIVTMRYPGMDRRLKKKEEEVEKELAAKEKKLKSVKNELDTIYELAKYVGVDDPKEIGKLIKKFWSLVEKKKALEKEIKEKKEAMNFDEMEKQREEINRELESIKEELQELGRPTMDINTIKQEIARLEGSGGGEAPGGFGGGFGESMDFMGGYEGVDDEAGQPPIFARILELGEKLSRRTRDQLISGITDHFDKYLSYLSNRRFFRARIEEDYTVSFNFAPADREVNWELLSAGDLLIIYLALHLSVAELVAINRSLPIVIDNSFALLDDSTHILVLKLLRKLAEKTQIILFSRREAAIKAATNVVKLG